MVSTIPAIPGKVSVAAFQATLTLPGIAGIVLTIGMAVDANVLIFDRIREEMRGGKTLRAAIDSGYSRAMSAIIDSNVTTDRKSTRLNSSHVAISYAVFCLQKKSMQI